MNRFLSSRRPGWWVPGGALLAFGAALVLALAGHRWLTAEARSETRHQQAVRKALDDAGTASAPSCGSEFDYAQSLPPSVSLDKFVQSLQDSSKALGASVLSVSGEPRPATTRTLAALEVDVALHGSYPAIKSTLAESLSRFDSGALLSLRIKRSGTTPPIVEDVNVRIGFALRPQASGPLDCAVTVIERAPARPK
jgi:hypothetical protein